jgi:hypothetical protein
MRSNRAIKVIKHENIAAFDPYEDNEGQARAESDVKRERVQTINDWIEKHRERSSADLKHSQRVIAAWKRR